MMTACAAASDDELMALARAGGRDAFAALVARHGSRLAEFCIKMVGDRRTGEDLAQETWLAVWAARTRYSGRDRLAAFLFAIARNRCRNALRARRRFTRVIVLDDADRGAPGGSSLDAMLDRELERRVHAAAAQLPAKLREALLLRFVAELDYPAISCAVGRNESTVRSRVFHALRKLRALVEEAA